MILFSEEVELYIPPKKGRQHTLRIIRELVNHEPTGKRTNLATPLTYVNNIIKKRCIAFVLSDFISEDYTDALRIAAKRHDVIGCKIYDKTERELPDAGLVKVVDSESGLEMLVDTSNKLVRDNYTRHFDDNHRSFKQRFVRSKSDTMIIEAGTSYIRLLHQFFKKRSGA